MAEYVAKLLNSTHPDRKHIEEVLKEYLFQSYESESDTEYMCDTESESDVMDEQDFGRSYLRTCKRDNGGHL